MSNDRSILVRRQNAFEHLTRIFRFLVIQFRCGKRQDTISDKRGIHNTRLTRHNWCGLIDRKGRVEKLVWTSRRFNVQRHLQLVGQERSFLTYQLTMALHVETSWCPYQLFRRTFSIDPTASIVSCQSCVVYTTFVGNSVLSLTTSELNY